MFQLAKYGTVVGLLRFSPSFLFACATSNRANLAFKTTIVKDSSNTNRYSIYGRGKQLFNFLPLQTYEKTFAEFPFLFIFIIPWLSKYYIMRSQAEDSHGVGCRGRRWYDKPRFLRVVGAALIGFNLALRKIWITLVFPKKPSALQYKRNTTNKHKLEMNIIPMVYWNFKLYY